MQNKTSSTEVEALKADVNFYRQESAIYEQRQAKLLQQVLKLKKKKAELKEKCKPREDIRDEEVQCKLISEDQVGKETQMASELTEANSKVKDLQERLETAIEESVSLKGENNSLRKKVQSLQIDMEKLSRRVENSLPASMGEEFDNDPIFNAETEAGMTCSLNNANITIGLESGNNNTGVLNQSIRSDNGLQTRSSKLDLAANNNSIINLSDECAENDFGDTGVTKQERNTITQRIMESHIGQDGSNIVLIEEVKQGKQKPPSIFIQDKIQDDVLPPTSTLQMLADENISMKEDIELKCKQIMEYKFMIQECSDKLAAEIEKNRNYQTLHERLNKNNSVFTS